MSERDWELQGSDLETFKSLDGPTRKLILRLLDEPTDADFESLRSHPNRLMLATWLGELPAYRGGYDDGEDDGDE